MAGAKRRAGRWAHRSATWPPWPSSASPWYPSCTLWWAVSARSAQINTTPVAWPHPWVFSNYSGILSSSSFWHYVGNSMFIAVVATVLAWASGHWPPSPWPVTRSRAGRLFRAVHGRPAFPRRRGQPPPLPVVAQDRAAGKPNGSGPARGGVLPSLHHLYLAAVPAGRPRRARRRRRGRWGQPVQVFPFGAYTSVETGADHGLHTGVYLRAGTPTCCLYWCSTTRTTTRCRSAWPAFQTTYSQNTAAVLALQRCRWSRRWPSSSWPSGELWAGWPGP